MRNYLITSICCIGLFLSFSLSAKPQKNILKVKKETLMHEIRTTHSPYDGQHIQINPPRFMWPDKFPHLGPVLDGVEEHEEKPHVTYKIRIARDSNFTVNKIEAERNWAFYNPFRILEEGKWYWQHAYIDKNGKEEWSAIHNFYVDTNIKTFNPPSFDEILSKLPKSHPRVLLSKEEWDGIIIRNQNNPEAQAYIMKAKKAISHPLLHLSQEIDTSKISGLANEVQQKSLLIRESRKIVDREEANIEAMVRAYLLTKEPIYYKEAMKRLTEILSWRDSKYFAGDFNLSTILSMSTSAYDAFYDLLSDKEKKLLQKSIQENGGKFFEEYVNHLENRIADNHVWQMTLRILTMASFSTLGEIPEATQWADYCYNVWVSRFPGLNDDGAWHNGDSYFHVNIRTLIEVPAFYSRITGFNYFDDPWYNNNVSYVIYHQPPFSKSAGHGNSHETKKTPNGARVGYADALARECNNPWAAAYVRYITERDPDILSSSFEGKSGDLTWYRCTTNKTLAGEKHSLAEMPSAKVFNEIGVATMHTSLGSPEKNAMLSFRSSPYGSTSHALANQNAFNTFYGGKAIFYSSGHRTGFTDDHCMYSYRNTRAHNTILVNGMGQKIGTEGYGWIPRYYEGEKISYVVGDASNAYGKVTSPLWLERARLSGTEFTPENGWDENKLEFFRRHIIQLGKSGIYVIYDELEGKEPVEWSFLLHTTEYPMEVSEMSDRIIVKGKNDTGVSVAHLFSSDEVQCNITDKFFSPPANWLNKTNSKGELIKYADHWHFTATTKKSKISRFLTIIDTYGNSETDRTVEHTGNEIIIGGEWKVICNLNKDGKAFINIENKKENVFLSYDPVKEEGSTIIKDIVKGQVVNKKLIDFLPDMEI